MPQSTPDIREQLKSDAGTFALLARLWISEVDLPLLQQLHHGEVCESYLTAGGYVPSNADEATVEQLSIEFCACFLGPKGHLPPHQSVVQSSNFQSNCIDSMRKYIEVIGEPQGIFAQQTMLDHAGVQLSLMHSICDSAVSDDDLSENMLQSTASNDDLSEKKLQLTSLIDLRNCFYRDHLHWIQQYCAVAIKKSKSNFYSALFDMTATFLLQFETE